jgi:hypothetical protein
VGVVESNLLWESTDSSKNAAPIDHKFGKEIANVCQAKPQSVH